ncbi:MAG: RimK family protein [Balneolaceae bacterium]|nr:RimK family protein [Balneolaceae bacterium]
MRNIVVVNQPKHWPLDLPGVEVVAVRAYLGDPEWSRVRRVRVFNMCRSYRYQSAGYYVSLLAEARGHKPLPGVMTIQDLKSQTMVRFVSDELIELIQKSLRPIQGDRFVLSIYFGRNTARRYDRLSRKLFAQFRAPLLRAHFLRGAGGWGLQSIGPIPAGEVPESHRDFVGRVAREYFEGRRSELAPGRETRFDLAILRNSEEKFPPSDEKAIRAFVKAAEQLDFYVEQIGREDYARLAEFDALFIRETTSVNHHTYRFARRAAAEGLVVIDDPESILRCTNKVYLAELLQRNRIPAPSTIILGEGQEERLEREIGFPCILKQPDSSFSQGVVKVDAREDLQPALERLFDKSELLIAQEFLPTEYDWRVGVLNRQPFYACRYFMARKHWQIYEQHASGRVFAGRAEAVPVEEAPPEVIETALAAANLIGDGLYGVDLKLTGGKVYVIEVNDNPSIDSGCEDACLGEELYRRVMEEMLRRVEQKKERSTRSRNGAP